MAQITNDLLKQAIADAEAVRETAVANAKLVLEEAITPQIRDMIANRLRVESSDKATQKPHEDGRAIGSAQMPAGTSKIGDGENKEPSDDSFYTSNVGTGPENAGTSDDDWYEDWNETDFDLNEVIAELEADILALEGMGGAPPHDHMGRSTSHTDPNMYDSAVTPTNEEEEFDDVSLEEILKDLEDENEEDDDMEDEDDMESDASDRPPVGMMKKETSMAPDMDDMGDEMDDGDLDEDFDLYEVLSELLADEDDDDADVDDEDDEEEDDSPRRPEERNKSKDAQHLARQMSNENVKLRRELAEYRGAVNTLRGKLHEVNLLNAKLLFTNKMFRTGGLSNDQKVRIVESFDRATTVREVKLVYTALMENMNVSAGSVGTSRRKVVAEGIASRAQHSTAPRKEVIVENSVAKRLQELAGLI